MVYGSADADQKGEMVAEIKNRPPVAFFTGRLQKINPEGAHAPSSRHGDVNDNSGTNFEHPSDEENWDSDNTAVRSDHVEIQEVAWWTRQARHQCH